MEEARLFYHGDCVYFFSNGARNYCGFFQGYPDCASFVQCEVHQKLREKEREEKGEAAIDWESIVKETDKALIKKMKGKDRDDGKP